MQVISDSANRVVHAFFLWLFRWGMVEPGSLMCWPTHDMQQLIEPTTEYTPGRGGGRAASDPYRQSLDLCDDFTGLDEDTNRYDLLLLVKRVGKAAGFTPRMIHLLDYYMAYTRDMDWEEGSRPIVFQSVSRTALDMGVSERQIQKLENRLFEIGAISWNDSGNHRRFGQRDAKTGRILYAYGVDLTPLAYLKADLEDKLHQKQLYDQVWMETKRQISWYRRQIRSLLIDCEEGADVGSWEQSYDEIAIEIRTYMRLEQLRQLLDQHKQLHNQILASVTAEDAPSDAHSVIPETQQSLPKGSCSRDIEFANYKSTTQGSFDKSNTDSPTDIRLQKGNSQNPVNKTDRAGMNPRSEPRQLSSDDDLSSRSGLQHITLKLALQAASDRFHERLPLSPHSITWRDVVTAADRLRSEFGVSQRSWAEVCALLGRTGAAVCVLVTDRAALRVENPVRQPAAYFNGMVRRARGGELRLHHSIFGLVERSV